jgi:ATP/maltotriose-dependent transcriptional regulator MalT/DNA-binding SARP family transcriptional activator
VAESRQVQPPPIPAWFVPRPHLFGVLQGGRHHRLTSVVAGPGYGKSTVLAAWGLAMGCAWYTAQATDASASSFARGLAQAFRRRLPALRPDLEAALTAGGDREDPGHAELLAGLICDALEPVLRSDLPLVIDGAEHLGTGGPSLRLVDALCRQAPPGLRLVVASRFALPSELTRTTASSLFAIGPADLAFSLEETAGLFASTVGPFDPEALRTLHARTGGWPAALRLVVESLLQGDADADAGGGERTDLTPTTADGPFASLADEVLQREPPDVLELLSQMSAFDRFTPELCVALGIEDAPRSLDSLIRRGMFIQDQGGVEGWLTLHALLREYAIDRWPIDVSRRQEIQRRASGWFAERGFVADALLALERAGDPSAMRGFLILHGHALLDAGHGTRLIDVGERAAALVHHPELEMLLGWARRLRGDWDEAFEHYRRAAGDGGSLPIGLAWRMAEGHYLRSELTEAVGAAERADHGEGSDHDRVMLLTWEASARRRLGDRDVALGLARAAVDIAERTKDPDDILASFTTELGILDLPAGDPFAERRDLAALRAVKEAKSAWLRIRVLTNRAEALAYQARLSEAGELTDAALELAESSGDPFSMGRVLEIRAVAALAQGRLTETVNDARAARSLYERAGSQMAAQASLLLGHAHRETGELAAAREAYAHALRVGEETSNAEVVQGALAGSVRLLALEDPVRARRQADRASNMHLAPAESRCQVMLAAGWAALAAGDGERARGLADEATHLANEQRYGPHLAESFELAAMAVANPDLSGLERALDVWRDIGHPVGMARIDVALATLAPMPASRHPDLAVALRRLQALGVRPSAAAGAAGLLAALPQPHAAPVEIRTLGGFGLLRDGHPVRFSEWKSKKARDVLKILVARRGLPTHREFLMEALWPEEPPEGSSNRLSVALSIVRTVLDPARRHGTQHFVTGEGDSVWLNLDTLEVDVERFVRSGPAALAAARRSEGDEVLMELEAAEAMYAGDFLEEDPYEDWATALREEAKSLYGEVGRDLAFMALRGKRYDAAVRYGLKILSRDPYDEVAHLLIVRALALAGRHGEARRRYRTYVAALEDIGVAPSSYPTVPSEPPATA